MTVLAPTTVGALLPPLPTGDCVECGRAKKGGCPEPRTRNGETCSLPAAFTKVTWTSQCPLGLPSPLPYRNHNTHLPGMVRRLMTQSESLTAPNKSKVCVCFSSKDFLVGAVREEEPVGRGSLSYSCSTPQTVRITVVGQTRKCYP